MFNIKWSVVCAAVAFVLAFVLSLLLGHTTLLIALLRAGIFAALFFGLGAAVWALINTFLPELLASGEEKDIVGSVFSPETSGSKVNITVDDAPSAALPGTNNDEADPEEVGNFGDLVIGAIPASEDVDQNPSTGYTEEAEEISPVFGNVKLEEAGDFSMDFGAFVSDGLDGEEGQEDLDTFSFLPGSGDTKEFSPPERKASGNKPLKLEGDFNPKEIAAGLRTVLEKDKKRG